MDEYRVLVTTFLKGDSYWLLNKKMTHILGSFDASGLFSDLLSKEGYFIDNMEDDDGWFFNTAETILEDTGLSKYKQKRAIEILKKHDILETQRKGYLGKQYFKFNHKKIYELLFPPVENSKKLKNLTSRSKKTSLQEVKKLNFSTNKNKNNKNKKNKHIHKRVRMDSPLGKKNKKPNRPKRTRSTPEQKEKKEYTKFENEMLSIIIENIKIAHESYYHTKLDWKAMGGGFLGWRSSLKKFVNNWLIYKDQNPKKKWRYLLKVMEFYSSNIHDQFMPKITKGNFLNIENIPNVVIQYEEKTNPKQKTNRPSQGHYDDKFMRKLEKRAKIKKFTGNE